MKNMVKNKNVKITVTVALFMVLVSGIILTKLLGVSFAGSGLDKWDTVRVGNGMYKIIDVEKFGMFAKYLFPVKKTASVTIPDTIKAGGETYKIVGIEKNAFKGNKKLKKLVIGSKVVLVGKQACYGCKNLKDITIKASNLNKSGVKANAFKGINSKAVIKVPEQKLSEYKEILKARGVTGKNQTIKGMKMEEEEVPEITFGPDHPLPEPQEAIASIGNIAKAATNNFEKRKIAETSEYSTGDSILFSARVQMHPDLFGQFGQREAYGRWIFCPVCKQAFDSVIEFAIHGHMSSGFCSENSRTILAGQKEAFIETYWTPDNTPCKTVFCFTLPEGLSYERDGIRLLYSKTEEIDNSAYHVDISGQELTLTIDDIKKEPFFYTDPATDGGCFRAPISVLINAEMNDDTAAVNTASASVSYNYKGLDKTIDLGTMSVYAASLQFKNTDASGNAVDGSKFTLYKEKTVYNSAGWGAPQYFEIAEGTSRDGLLTFKGIGEGRYKLVQTEVPVGYKKMDSLVFNVDLAGKDGSITSLGVTDKSGRKLPWDAEAQTGVINATIVNQ